MRAGWAPFWRYRELGLLRRAARPPPPLRRPRSRSWCALPRPRRRAAARPSTGSAGSSASARAWSTRSRATTRAASWRPAGGRSVLGPVVRAGARLGQFAPPEVWRARRTRCRSTCSATAATPHRPRLDAGSAAAAACDAYADDIDLLERAHRAGLRRLALARAAAAPSPQRRRDRRRRWPQGQRTQVTRSCAPSGRAAST